jgi:putative ABC transport system substrate-binding protein
LDAARKGFTDALESGGYRDGENVLFTFVSADGSSERAQEIAQQFAKEKMDLIFALSTVSAKAVAQYAPQTPLVFSAVSNPVEAGLITSYEKPGKNATGTSDMIPVAAHIQLLRELFPTAKTVGVIYNNEDASSLLQVKEVKRNANVYGLGYKEAVVSETKEVAQQAAKLFEEIDVLYLPADLTTLKGLKIVLSLAKKKGVPVIAAEATSVKQGALATIEVDYYRLGFEAGKHAIEIMQGKKPGEIAALKEVEGKIIINEKTAQAYRIAIPQALKNNAHFIDSP